MDTIQITQAIRELRQMTVGELREKYIEVFGEANRSRNRDYLIRRIAWRIQANAEGGITETVRAANALGLKTKSYQTRAGKWNGGLSYSKTSIYALLSNVHYLGKIPLQDDLYEGEHDAIIDESTWEAVQRLFKRNAVGFASVPGTSETAGILAPGGAGYCA